MKFSDYKRDKTKDNARSEVKIDETQERLVKNFLNGYEGKQKSEIISEIVKVAEKNRREGKLSDKDLDDFSNMISPMIGPEQKKELQEIISRLKTQR